MTPEIYAKDQHKIALDDIDPDALCVLEKLRSKGYEAYLVGGSVRDLLLGHKPKDFDISTSALPEEIKPLFRQCFLVGRRFRLAHVRFGKKVIEISTFRKGDNEDDSLITRDNSWGSPEEDVLRRDFTINGLFYDSEKEEIIDYVGGYKDAKRRFLRSIGNPFIRFRQDPVRMIRLLKFRARFALNVQEEAIKALFECRKDILKSAPARVLEEFLRMLESSVASTFIKLLQEHGFIEAMLPGLSKFFESKKGSEVLSFLEEIDRVLQTNAGSKISRSVLISAILFPPLDAHLQTLQLERKKPMHLGEIVEACHFITKDMFYPFLSLPRKIHARVVTILASQYRFTPLVKRKKHSYRIPRVPDFNLAMDFFWIRSCLEPGLIELYDEWAAHYKKHRSNHKPVKPAKKRRHRR